MCVIVAPFIAASVTVYAQENAGEKMEKKGEKMEKKVETKEKKDGRK